MLPLITLEEHYVSESLQNSPYAKNLGLDLFPPVVSRKLLSLDAERIQDMDDGGVSIQVISHNPGAGSLPLEMCEQANDQLYEAIRMHGSRFAAFAALPMTEPAAAAEELSRCVLKLNFVGALISNHADGQYYDDPNFWPVFERAQDLDVPIYLHPTFAQGERMSEFQGYFGEAETSAMSAYAWGWHSDVGLHFLRLFASGLFDSYPRLRIVIGHMGEMLPFMLDRIQRFTPRWKPKKRGIDVVWNENVWITTSGMFTLAPFACLLRTTKIEKILFSVDYPFENNRQGTEFMRMLQQSELVTEQELRMIAYGNAEKLLKIRIEKEGKI